MMICYFFFYFSGSDHLPLLFFDAASHPHSVVFGAGPLLRPDASRDYGISFSLFLGLMALLVFEEPKFCHIVPYYLFWNFIVILIYLSKLDLFNSTF
jgi:hypothetical protein